MLLTRQPVRARVMRLSLWLGAGLLGLSLFFLITHELLERELLSIDHTVLLAAGKIRFPGLTVVALDVTALGSTTIVSLISASALGILFLLRDYRGALQLLLASVGAGILTQLTKHVVERPRPEELPRLISASGFSYPSGHTLGAAALYSTIAILALRHFRTTKAQATVLVMALFIIMLVGFSRVYLGVHFPTDVIGGMSLGLGWALLLTGGFAWMNRTEPSS